MVDREQPLKLQSKTSTIRAGFYQGLMELVYEADNVFYMANVWHSSGILREESWGISEIELEKGGFGKRWYPHFQHYGVTAMEE
ncbi:hypothetical protein STEG23_023846 [Scotinomys teguina]